MTAAALTSATTPLAAVAAESPVDVVRAWGYTRYQTSAALSAVSFTPGVDAVYVATGTDYPDALAAGPAAAGHGPVMLVDGSALDGAVVDEVRRLRPGRIVLVGADGVVPDSVGAALSGLTTTHIVQRLAGADRYATAAALSRQAFAPHHSVSFVATGADYPDALSASVLRARLGGPVLLVTRSTLPTATATELARLQPSRVVIVGGEAAVSSALQRKLAAPGRIVSRVAGPDRYSTNLRAMRLVPDAETVFLATGADYPEAIAAAAALASRRGLLLTIDGNVLPADVAAEVRRRAPRHAVVAGSIIAVSEPVGNHSGG